MSERYLNFRGASYEMPADAWRMSFADDSKRCRWPECGCYQPQGPQYCRKSRGEAATLSESKEQTR